MPNETESETTFWELIGKYSIEIPMVQRDYAQGRREERVMYIRKAFLESLYAAVDSGPPLKLDFIYGRIEAADTEGTNKLIPIDGQQRLTTLFLLHFYAALQSGAMSVNGDARNRLSKFTYLTRPHSTDFCKALVSYCGVSFNTDTPSIFIKDQPWFIASWELDPTVDAMLVMIDEIHVSQFGSINPKSLYSALTRKESPAISFDFEEFEELNLDDEMYIKMNSRGRPLSDFESFKARFEKFLEEKHGHQTRTLFSQKIDGKEWTDVFWKRDHALSFDRRFSAFFLFFTEVLYHKSAGITDDTVLEFKPNKSDPDYWKPYYIEKESVDRLVEYTDVLVSMNCPSAFFENWFSNVMEDDLRLPLFDECANPFEHVIADTRIEIFWKVLLYFVLEYVRLNGLPENRDPDFLDRARTIRNLANRVRYLRWPRFDSNLRSEELGLYFSSVDQILSLPRPYYQTVQDLDRLPGFTASSFEFEQHKARLYCNNPDLQACIFAMEDRTEFRGSVHALLNTTDPQEIPQLFETFKEVWDAEIESVDMLISRALIAFGFAGNRLGGWSAIGARRFFGGDKDQRETLLSFVGDDKYQISEYLVPFLRKVSVLWETTDRTKAVLEEIIRLGLHQYLHQTPLPWQYYALTYEKFLGDEQRLFAFKSEFEIERLSKITAASTHINPLIALAIEKIGDDSICSKAESATYGRDSSALVVKSGDRQVARVFSDAAGWRLRFEETPPTVPSLTELEPMSDEENAFLLPVSGDEDRIDKIISFIKSLISELHDGETKNGAAGHPSV